jgi:hypothetical protein
VIAEFIDRLAPLGAEKRAVMTERAVACRMVQWSVPNRLEIASPFFPFSLSPSVKLGSLDLGRERSSLAGSRGNRTIDEPCTM